MSTPKHTPEPWILSDDSEPDRVGGAGQYPPAYEPKAGPRFVFGTDAAGRTVSPRRADLARAVQCVNACAGMDDPAAEIARLREIERALTYIANGNTCDPSTADYADRALRRALTPKEP